MSCQFLNQKSWHVNNKANQRKIWIAEQKHTDDIKRQKERQREFEEEQEYFKNKQKLGMSEREVEKNKSQETINFMYAPPPGLITDKTALLPSDKDKSDRDLETEKFPFLKNAPVQGIYTENMKITHKPFGIELRNVKCARCGNWGHTSGDRECPMKDFNPNDSQRQKLEDPLTHIQSREMQLHKEKLILKNGGRSPIRGGMTENDPNQQMLPESESESSDAEREFLATLTPKQKKKLLKKYKEQQKKKKKQDREKETGSSSKKHHKKHKHSSSDSSDSSSDSEAHKKEKKRKREKSDNIDSEDETRESKKSKSCSHASESK